MVDTGGALTLLAVGLHQPHNFRGDLRGPPSGARASARLRDLNSSRKAIGYINVRPAFRHTHSTDMHKKREGAPKQQHAGPPRESPWTLVSKKVLTTKSNLPNAAQPSEWKGTFGSTYRLRSAHAAGAGVWGTHTLHQDLGCCSPACTSQPSSFHPWATFNCHSSPAPNRPCPRATPHHPWALPAYSYPPRPLTRFGQQRAAQGEALPTLSLNPP